MALKPGMWSLSSESAGVSSTESWQGRSFLLLPSLIAAYLVALNDANDYVTALQVGSPMWVSKIKVS